MRVRMAKSRSRFLVSTVLVIGLGVLEPSSIAAATLHTYRAGIDVDNNNATGCDFSLGSVPPMTLPGFELQITVVVDQALNPPQVVSAELETCDGAVFSDPQPLAGFVLELNNGLLGADSVIGSIPLSLLGGNHVVRLAFHALSSAGAEDALFTTTGSAQGLPIIVVISVPASAPLLSQLGLGLLILILLAVALRASRTQRSAVAGLVLLVLGAAAVVYAAFGDPIALDDPADSMPADTRAEIIAGFAMVSDSELALRLDIKDIPIEAICNDSTDDDLDNLIDCLDPDCSQQPCNDGFGCTLSDQCVDGECRGTPKDCNDNNPCTLDICVSVSPDPGDNHFMCQYQPDNENPQCN